jgi:hypothetical protein
MAQFSSGVGLIPEQSWELPTSPPRRSAPTRRLLRSASSTASRGFGIALVWSAGSFVRLAADLRAGSLVDQPANTVQRYVDNTQGQTDLSVDTRWTTPRSPDLR